MSNEIKTELSEEQDYANKLGAQVVPLNRSKEVILGLWSAGLLPILHGGSGIGKTALAPQLAKHLGADYQVHDCSLLQPEDYAVGYPEDGFLKMLKAHWVQKIIANDAKGIPTVVLFDEITRYTPGSASALFGILGSRKLYDWEFPKSCYIYAACNPQTKGFQVGDILSDEAWRRRGCHLVVKAEVSSWLKYAKANNFHEYVINYVESHRTELIDFPAKNAGKIYANPAQWEKVSSFLLANEGNLDTTVLSTLLNVDRAKHFIKFTQNVEWHITAEQILLGKWPESLKTLNKIKQERADLFSSIIDNVINFIEEETPNPDTCANNIAQLSTMLSPENLVILYNALEGGNSCSLDAPYQEKLMGEIIKHKDWETKILPVVDKALGRNLS